ncbi:MAG: ribosome assembly cofactor RimP [Bacteroidales bacterium]|nr:ribosome assembly cofactor RimP [Bacteroidales bacterium]
MYSKETILKMAEDILKSESEDFTNNDIFITDVKISNDNRITVSIDSFEGIKIKDCALLSKKIEGKLDRENEDFELLVSSAGLDNAFKVLKQYEKNIGKLIKLLTVDGEKLKGKLISVTKNEIEIEPEIKKTKKNKLKTLNKEENINMAMNLIKEARVVITF